MSNLINIETKNINGELIQTVNARDLHAFLEITTRFNDWINRRITEYSFEENIDYIIVENLSYSNLSSAKSRQRPMKDYCISIDMAKELSMVERNEKGKQARQYFIECERKALEAVSPVEILNDPSAMRGLLLNYTEKVIALKHTVDDMKPQVEALKRISYSEGSLCITDAAKSLKMKPKALFSWLQGHDWIYRRVGGKSWVGYQDKIKQDLIEHKVTVVARNDGSEKLTEQVRITPKGLGKLSVLISE
ncbi:phage antirepressor KilAC domain-containing protein [Candidatus Arsenophonus triatominarum]|uniref:phage antirepressor KilAC domain-containing protein n=1 Tax=Candidatus Arsenophonus triatominarum TaxID=57911 RepID=UPI0007C4B601|nr:phage antirepressor KilAC domain-containing protein [Candidatus Arsenophonus triatominarum]